MWSIFEAAKRSNQRFWKEGGGQFLGMAVRRQCCQSDLKSSSRYIFDGLEGLGSDMEALQSGLQMMSRKDSKEIYDGNKEHNIFMRGIASRVISEDPCINQMIKVGEGVPRFEKDTVMLFDYALLSLWADRYLPRKEHEALLELTELFRAEMEEVFKENEWMDKKSKEKAIKKLQTIKFNIGYPIEILDEEKMKAYHDQFLTDIMDPGAFVENKVFICIDD